jgi:CarD family transcriptional regulator
MGDVVLYGIQGICKISGIEVKQIGKTALDYYVLNPVFNESTALFVPVDNEKLTTKMQNILGVKEVKQLIEKAQQISVLEICDEATKRERYREILSSGNREELISLIKTIRLEREKRSKLNKKLNMSDEQTLYKAERLLFNEIAYVLEIEPQEVQKMITF